MWRRGFGILILVNQKVLNSEQPLRWLKTETFDSVLYIYKLLSSAFCLSLIHEKLYFYSDIKKVFFCGSVLSELNCSRKPSRSVHGVKTKMRDKTVYITTGTKRLRS